MLALIAAIAAGQTFSLSLNVPDGSGEPEFIAAMREQIRMGVNGSYVSLTWPELEPTPNTFNRAKLDESVGIGKLVGGSQLLTIKTIDTVKPVLPGDIADKPFADKVVQDRFVAFAERLTPALPKSIKWLSLGNEVDGYLNDKPEAQAAFLTMINRAREAIHKTRPDISVSLTLTYSGIKAHPDQAKALLESSDVLIATYYPLNPDFTPLPADQVPAHLKTLIDSAGTRKVVLQEVGYPASPVLGSSEEKQAAFVTQALTSISKTPQITFANYFIQGDFTPIQMGYFAQYYGSTDPKFIAYLSSLGLRDATGKPRLALRAFRDQVRPLTDN